MKHTPGPWHLDIDVVVSKAQKDGDWPVVCKMKGPEIDGFNPFDGRLIAKAPELLQMVDILEKTVRHAAEQALLRGLTTVSEEYFKRADYALELRKKAMGD
jgi:hypothetical protein